MGCDRQFTCVTCRQTYNLGYGSYTSWVDGTDSLKTYADFESLDSPHKTLLKNQNFGRCLQIHEGHDWLTWSYDYCSEENGDLYITAGYGHEELFIADLGTFQFTDLYEDWYK